MSFQPVFNPYEQRPKTANRRNQLVPLHALVRDQFSIATWLVLGGMIQGIAHLVLPYRNIVLVLPVLLILLFKATNTALILFGILPNPRMKDTLLYRVAPVIPTEKGVQDKAGDSTVCAFLLASISNHPLGMLGPHVKEIGDLFEGMLTELSADASKNGFLGASSWTNAGLRTTSNEVMAILYFENQDYMFEYAHGPLHAKSMEWWHSKEEKLKHIGIMHEIFSCPKKGWEGVYLNYQPTGIGSTTKEVTRLDGKKVWMSPLVRGKGKLSYPKGRMGRAYGEDEWVAYEKMLAAGAGDEA